VKTTLFTRRQTKPMRLIPRKAPLQRLAQRVKTTLFTRRQTKLIRRIPRKAPKATLRQIKK
jgi:hypothetical protein